MIAPSTRRAAFAPTVAMTSSAPPQSPVPVSPASPAAAEARAAVASLPTLVAPGTPPPPAPADASPSGGSSWRRRLSWLALLGLVGMCGLGVVAAIGAAFLVPREWVGLATPAPTTTSPPPSTSSTPLAPASLGGPSGACELAYTCCDEYRRMIGRDAACEAVHDYDREPRSLCDQVRMQYRSALELQRYDTRMCDP